MKLKYGPYSPSRLDTGICGFAFYKQYVDPNRKKQPGSLAADRGSAVHEVFEQMTKQMIEKPDYMFTEAEIRGWIVTAVNNNPASYQSTDEIIEMCKKYVENPPKVLVSDAEVELKLAVKMVGPGKFEACDYNDPQAFARGKQDILMISDDTTHSLIYDHKTQPNVEEADTFQMGVYAWMISKTYPFLDEVHTVLHFARYGKYSNPFIWDRESLARIEDELVTRVSIIEGRDQWVATPHSKCQYCTFMAQCPAIAEYVMIDDKGRIIINDKNFQILGDTGKAVKLAGLLNVMEEMSKEIKKELRGHIKLSESPIAIPGKIYEFRVDEKIHWDKVNKTLRDQVYAVFAKHNMDPRSFMGFSQTFSTGVWRTGNEALVKELSDLLPRKNETRFAGYKG